MSIGCQISYIVLDENINWFNRKMRIFSIFVLKVFFLFFSLEEALLRCELWMLFVSYFKCECCLCSIPSYLQCIGFASTHMHLWHIIGITSTNITLLSIVMHTIHGISKIPCSFFLSFYVFLCLFFAFFQLFSAFFYFLSFQIDNIRLTDIHIPQDASI